MIDSILRLGMFPAVLIIGFLDEDSLNSHLPHCVFKYLFDIECWGCGMTRAILELCKFNFEKAITLNPTSPIVLILICSIFLGEIFNKGKTVWLNLR